jgi:hypothetical protein
MLPRNVQETVIMSDHLSHKGQEKVNDLHSSLNNVRLIKSRRMRWAGHVMRMGEKRGVYRFLVGKT